MINNLKPINIADKISELSGIDVFANNRESQFIFDNDISHDEINQIDYLEKKCKRLEKKLEEQLNK